MALSDLLKAMNDPQRREILLMLRSGRMSAGEIADKLNISQAALSYHLKLLKKADVILEYKAKNFIFYELNTTVFEELVIWIQQLKEDI
jgi:DNA-binding transcriptional ArsR family regulator